MKATRLWMTSAVVCLALMPSAGLPATLVAYPPQGIVDAVRSSSPGDTILVSPGTYFNETGGVIRHPLTIIGVGGAEANEIGVCFALCQPFLFSVDYGVQDVLIEGLTMTTSNFEHDPLGAIAMEVSGGPGVVIRNCVFHDLQIGVNVLWGHVSLQSCLFYGGNVRENLSCVAIRAGSGDIVGNTLVRSYSGILLTEGATADISRNIVANNWEGGIGCFSGSTPTLECNDVWGNPAGNYIGCVDPTGTNGNISSDPLFCDLAGLDFRLHPESPCLPENSPPGCGLIGALGPCEPVVSVPDAGWATMRLLVTPNPMRHQAEIMYDAGLQSPMLEIYDPQGRVVDVVRPGVPPYVWQPGQTAGPGVYFVRLRTGGSSAVSKVVLLPR
jgi:hypothetical protein